MKPHGSPAGKRSLPRRLAYLALGLAVLALAHPGDLAAGTKARVEVPIAQHRLSNGDVRFTVRVRVGGGAPIEAMLDTGSFGLRVMERALAPTQYEATAVTRGYGYGSGVVLRGPLSKAVVAVGDATTGAPVTIQVVQSVGCQPARPNCPAARLDLADYGIGGDRLAREGFEAILGISLRGSDAPEAAINPLKVMGNQSWIVILPEPGAAAPGALIVNPGPSDLVGFHPVQLQDMPPQPGGGRQQVNDAQIPNCPDRPLEQQRSCPMMQIDSGSRPGVPPFYDYAVFFDQKHGAIGVKHR